MISEEVGGKSGTAFISHQEVIYEESNKAKQLFFHVVVKDGWAPHLFRAQFVLQQLFVILELQVLNQLLFIDRRQELCQHQLLNLLCTQSEVNHTNLS